MYHRGLQTLLIHHLMNKLMAQKLLRLTGRTQNAKDSWFLANKLVAIQPSIETSSQPGRLNLIRDRILKFRLQIRQKISSNSLI